MGRRGRRRTATPRRCPTVQNSTTQRACSDRRPGWRASARQSRCRPRSRRSRAAARRTPRIRRCRPCRSISSTTPATCSRTGQRSRAAGGGVTCSQRGPAVNMKPAMKSGMYAAAKMNPCAIVGGIAVTTAAPACGTTSSPGPRERHQRAAARAGEEGEPVRREPAGSQPRAAARSVLAVADGVSGRGWRVRAESMLHGALSRPPAARRWHRAGSGSCGRYGPVPALSACEAGTKPPRWTSNTCTSPSSMT